jgi:hypothetical protein
MKKHFEHSLAGMWEAAIIESTAANRRDQAKRSDAHEDVRAEVITLMADNKVRDRLTIASTLDYSLSQIGQALRVLKEHGRVRLIPHPTKKGDKWGTLVIKHPYRQKEATCTNI